VSLTTDETKEWGGKGQAVSELPGQSRDMFALLILRRWLLIRINPSCHACGHLSGYAFDASHGRVWSLMLELRRLEEPVSANDNFLDRDLIVNRRSGIRTRKNSMGRIVSTLFVSHAM